MEVRALEDGRAMSKIMQGVTTEVLGESSSAGPYQGKLTPPRIGKHPQWTTLGGYFDTTLHTEMTTNPKANRGQAVVHTATRGIWHAGLRSNRLTPTLQATVPLEPDPVHFWRDYLKDVLDERTKG